MNTKTIAFGILAILAMAIFASTMVLAEDDNTMDNNLTTNTCLNDSDGNECGLNPTTNVTNIDSGKIFWKQAGLWFTFNQERKVEKEMNLAQLRLQQAEYATLNNNTKVAEKAMNSYNKLMERVNKRNQKIEEREEKQSLNESVSKLAAMDKAILAHETSIVRISDKLAIANLTEEEKTILEARLAKAQNSTAHLKEVQARKEERIQTRLMAQKNLTEDEAEEEIDDAKIQNRNQKVKGN